MNPTFKMRNCRLPSTIFQNILPVLPLILSLIVVTSFHVVLGEQVPKVAVLRTPERFALAAAPFMRCSSSFSRALLDLLDGAYPPGAAPVRIAGQRRPLPGILR